jgi:hypothetical protein
MTEKRVYPKCGNELPSNAPAGVCPRWLLQAGLMELSPEMVSAGTDATVLTDSTAPSDRANELPTVRDVATSKIAPVTGEKVRYFGECSTRMIEAIGDGDTRRLRRWPTMSDDS